MADTVTFTRGNNFSATFGWTPGATGPANLLAPALTSVGYARIYAIGKLTPV